MKKENFGHIKKKNCHREPKKNQQKRKLEERRLVITSHQRKTNTIFFWFVKKRLHWGRGEGPKTTINIPVWGGVYEPLFNNRTKKKEPTPLISPQ